LTCLDTGIWDHERPSCTPYGCPPPKELVLASLLSLLSHHILFNIFHICIYRIEHGYIIFTTNKSNQIFVYDSEGNAINDLFERKTYHYDDTVAVSCHRGYKFRENYNLLTEFKLQCSANGTWTGIIPDCIPRVCPWPNNVENARIYLKRRDNATIEVPIKESKISESDRITTEIFPDVFIPGAEIIIICDTGYRLIGDNIKTCTEQEDWSLTSTFCEPYNCSFEAHAILKFFRVLENKTIFSLKNDTNMVPIESTEKWHDIENITSVYKNFKIFVEGNAYGQRIILMCQNNMQMNLNKLINETILNITWICNKAAEWEILNLQEFEFEQLFNDSIYICDKSCAPPDVS